MSPRKLPLVAGFIGLLLVAQVHADQYADATELFKKASASNPFFANSYGYAIFPTVAKGGFILRIFNAL